MQLKLTVEYEGTRYQGWQVQPGGPTVQEALERALATALREPVRVRGAGRTDAGVHACGQVAAVKVTRVPADLGRLQKSLNALTPDDVAVREIAVVDDAFDPRRDARSRVYEYRILNAPAPSRRHQRTASRWSRSGTERAKLERTEGLAESLGVGGGGSLRVDDLHYREPRAQERWESPAPAPRGASEGSRSWSVGA